MPLLKAMCEAMFSSRKPDNYYAMCNPALLRAVPATAHRILDVGCGEGSLGRALKQMDPSRQVLGIECQPAVAARAAQYLDEVFTLDVQAADPAIPPGSLDCVVYGDVLEHLVDPEQVLRRHKRFLKPSGLVVCSIPNVQHHSILTALLTSDFQYTTAGLLDATHLRFFTYSTLTKLFLDAGFAPSLWGDVAAPCPPAVLEAARPLLQYLGLHPGRTHRYLSAYQYIVHGIPLPEPELPTDGASETPLSFVVCVTDEASLHANLLSSPCLGPDTPHEVLLARSCPNAAVGLNEGIAHARHAIVVCLHEDVYLPRGWPQRFLAQYRRAEAAFGRIGVAGVYGVFQEGTRTVAAGRVVDRDRLLAPGGTCPARVETLDDLLLAVPRETPLRFDPTLGFHLYGADLCLAARQGGLAVAAVDAPCFHHSRSAGLPESFWVSANRFKAKWCQRLPVVTPCVRIDQDGTMRVP
jgi:SAM-dependent methyltransferase